VTIAFVQNVDNSISSLRKLNLNECLRTGGRPREPLPMSSQSSRFVLRNQIF
jgi:hypothetical protein